MDNVAQLIESLSKEQRMAVCHLSGAASSNTSDPGLPPAQVSCLHIHVLRLLPCSIKRSLCMHVFMPHFASQFPCEGANLSSNFSMAIVWYTKLLLIFMAATYSKEPLSINVAMFAQPFIRLTLTDLLMATDNFSKTNMIEDDRFGTIHKATLPDGRNVAIKKLGYSSSQQGNKEFLAEMETLGKLQHKNFVPFLGYGSFGEEKVLVYEYMENGSLDLSKPSLCFDSVWIFGRHDLLEGGHSADALLWQRLNLSLGFLSEAIAIWVLFEWIDCPFVRVVSFFMLVSTVGLFAWSHGALILNRATQFVLRFAKTLQMEITNA